jgi:DNA primase
LFPRADFEKGKAVALISKLTIQEVNNRLDAVSIVGDYVRLEKKSGRYWGKCPFHAGGQEKTASFKVDPDSKLYHCFGCGKGGSVISFVMEMDKLTYPEAIKHIAQKTGVEITYEDGGAGEDEFDKTQREQLFELYKRTNVTFNHFLREKPEGQEALKYLEGRGISPEMIERFKLGFAPSDRNFLYKFLQSKGYSEGFLEKSGLFSARYKGMPLFSGRLMFPISDRQGRIVAFGGRAMPGAVQNDGREPPKYINSPETEIYKKGQTLYAFDLALDRIRQTKTVFLAEGYMDVIARHQGGITNAVAPLGTAFTDEQAHFLNRFVEKIVLILDLDEAGQKAAYKAIITCRKNGISCDVADMKKALIIGAGQAENQADLTKYKDPADILQKFGSKVLNNLLNCTINDFEYLFSRAKSLGGSDSGGKTRAAEFLFPYLDALDSEIERDDYIARIADSIPVDRGAVKEDYSKWKAGNFSRQSAVDNLQSGKLPQMNAEIRLLIAVAVNMNLFLEFRAAVEIKEIDDPFAKEIFIAMEDCFRHEESDINSLLERIQYEPLRKLIAGKGTTNEFKCEPARQIMEDGIKKIKEKRLLNRSKEITAQMRNIEREASDNTYDLEELLAEKMSIDSQLRELEGR